jgi:prepilin-type processing-associated H-X9-DG protein
MVRRSSRNRPAFSLVEMLIVIGILIVLMALLLPAMNRAREQSRRVVCAGNLHNMGAAIMKYATENNGKLPQHFGNSYWLFDIPLKTRDAMVTAGAVRKSFYCPSNADIQDSDGLWNYPTGNPTTAMHSATGYQWLFARPGPPPIVMPPFLTTQGTSRKYLKSIVDTQTVRYPTDTQARTITSSGEIELASDMVNSTGAPGSATENFNSPKGGFQINGTAVGHRTSHMGKGQKPAGGNVMFLDGHVEWRDFSAMHLQMQHAGTTGQNNYYF